MKFSIMIYLFIFIINYNRRVLYIHMLMHLFSPSKYVETYLWRCMKDMCCFEIQIICIMRQMIFIFFFFRSLDLELQLHLLYYLVSISFNITHKHHNKWYVIFNIRIRRRRHLHTRCICSFRRLATHTHALLLIQK